ncbi:hypothetical protein SSS_07058 [Sarcoptes scabiei]|uniref:AF-9 ANC1 homology domain-containing protein n=1 Tax=Sarcoptes scabiei TaxID=52283 RepID=A0A834R914_SARSC|nr:hypothetical protein SSS_07058 [Sarcoptes scabiei]
MFVHQNRLDLGTSGKIETPNRVQKRSHIKFIDQEKTKTNDLAKKSSPTIRLGSDSTRQSFQSFDTSIQRKTKFQPSFFTAEKKVANISTKSLTFESFNQNINNNNISSQKNLQYKEQSSLNSPRFSSNCAISNSESILPFQDGINSAARSQSSSLSSSRSTDSKEFFSILFKKPSIKTENSFYACETPTNMAEYSNRGFLGTKYKIPTISRSTKTSMANKNRSRDARHTLRPTIENESGPIDDSRLNSKYLKDEIPTNAIGLRKISDAAISKNIERFTKSDSNFILSQSDCQIGTSDSLDRHTATFRQVQAPAQQSSRHYFKSTFRPINNDTIANNPAKKRGTISTCSSSSPTPPSTSTTPITTSMRSKSSSKSSSNQIKSNTAASNDAILSSSLSQHRQDKPSPHLKVSTKSSILSSNRSTASNQLCEKNHASEKNRIESKSKVDSFNGQVRSNSSVKESLDTTIKSQKSDKVKTVAISGDDTLCTAKEADIDKGRSSKYLKPTLAGDKKSRKSSKKLKDLIVSDKDDEEYDNQETRAKYRNKKKSKSKDRHRSDSNIDNKTKSSKVITEQTESVIKKKSSQFESSASSMKTSSSKSLKKRKKRKRNQSESEIEENDVNNNLRAVINEKIQSDDENDGTSEDENENEIDPFQRNPKYRNESDSSVKNHRTDDKDLFVKPTSKKRRHESGSSISSTSSIQSLPKASLLSAKQPYPPYIPSPHPHPDYSYYYQQAKNSLSSNESSSFPSNAKILAASSTSSSAAMAAAVMASSKKTSNSKLEYNPDDIRFPALMMHNDKMNSSSDDSKQSSYLSLGSRSEYSNFSQPSPIHQLSHSKWISSPESRNDSQRSSESKGQTTTTSSSTNRKEQSKKYTKSSTVDMMNNISATEKSHLMSTKIKYRDDAGVTTIEIKSINKEKTWDNSNEFKKHKVSKESSSSSSTKQSTTTTTQNHPQSASSSNGSNIQDSSKISRSTSSLSSIASNTSIGKKSRHSRKHQHSVDMNENVLKSKKDAKSETKRNKNHCRSSSSSLSPSPNKDASSYVSKQQSNRIDRSLFHPNVVKNTAAIYADALKKDPHRPKRSKFERTSSSLSNNDECLSMDDEFDALKSSPTVSMVSSRPSKDSHYLHKNKMLLSNQKINEARKSMKRNSKNLETVLPSSASSVDDDDDVDDEDNDRSASSNSSANSEIDSEKLSNTSESESSESDSDDYSDDQSDGMVCGKNLHTKQRKRHSDKVKNEEETIETEQRSCEKNHHNQKGSAEIVANFTKTSRSFKTGRHDRNNNSEDESEEFFPHSLKTETTNAEASASIKFKDRSKSTKKCTKSKKISREISSEKKSKHPCKRSDDNSSSDNDYSDREVDDDHDHNAIPSLDSDEEVLNDQKNFDRSRKNRQKMKHRNGLKSCGEDGSIQKEHGDETDRKIKNLSKHSKISGNKSSDNPDINSKYKYKTAKGVGLSDSSDSEIESLENEIIENELKIKKRKDSKHSKSSKKRIEMKKTYSLAKSSSSLSSALESPESSSSSSSGSESSQSDDEISNKKFDDHPITSSPSSCDKSVGRISDYASAEYLHSATKCKVSSRLSSYQTNRFSQSHQIISDVENVSPISNENCGQIRIDSLTCYDRDRSPMMIANFSMVELQEICMKISTLQEPSILQRIVDVVEERNQRSFKIVDNCLQFDLMRLDSSTLHEIRKIIP